MRSRIRARAHTATRERVHVCEYVHELVLDRARDARMAEDIDHGG